MSVIGRLCLIVVLVEVLMAFAAYRQPLRASFAQSYPAAPDWPASSPPVYPSGFTPSNAIPATVLIPKETNYMHYVVDGWVYGFNSAGLRIKPDEVAFLSPQEHRYVYWRATHGEPWTRLADLGWSTLH